MLNLYKLHFILLKVLILIIFNALESLFTRKEKQFCCLVDGDLRSVDESRE